MNNAELQAFLERWFDIDYDFKDFLRVFNQSGRAFSRMIRDSRQVQLGDIFVAIPGDHFDANAFVSDAVTRGAALMMQPGELGYEWIGPDYESILCLRRPDLTDVLPEMAADFYGHPSKNLKLVAITGTNGKSSVCFLVASALEILGYPCGVIGTLGNGIWPDLYDSPNTTPEPVLLHQTLREWRRQGLVFGVLEASSHALVQNRLKGVEFETVALTQITSDHLDYHQTVDAYVGAKQKLMSDFGDPIRILNLDDAVGFIWAKQYSKVLGYTRTRLTSMLPNTLFYEAKETSQGLEIKQLPLGLTGCFSCLGLHNAENLMLAYQILVSLGQDATQVWHALQMAQFPPGRLMCLDWNSNKPLVFVDYAHTVDALERTIQALRAHQMALNRLNSRILLVFGCGGERDASKRKPMGKIAGLLCDYCIVTNDNPRSESPESIAQAIEEGLNETSVAWTRCLDRARAIAQAIEQACVFDYVLIAGKGHEKTQTIGHTVEPFSDQVVAQAALDCWHSK